MCITNRCPKPKYENGFLIIVLLALAILFSCLANNNVKLIAEDGRFFYIFISKITKRLSHYHISAMTT